MSEQLLSALGKYQILLTYEQGKLRFRAAKNSMTPQVKQAIKAHKAQLIKLLTAHSGFVQLAPQSLNQQSLFFAQQQAPYSSAYNLAITVKVHGELDAKRVGYALSRLFEEQPQTCAHFGLWSDGAETIPYQLIPESRPASLIEFDLKHLSNEQQIATIQQHYDEPIDLLAGPVFETRAYRLAEHSHVLMFKCHHIIADAWSLKIIAETIAAYYDNSTEARVSNASTANSNYLDYVIQQQESLRNGEFDKHSAHWQEVLNDYHSRLEYQNLAERPTHVQQEGDTLYFTLPEPLVARVKAFSRQETLSETALLYSAFHRLICEQTQRDDVAIGIPSLGARGARNSHTVGYYVNPIPLRCKIANNVTLGDHAKHCNHSLQESLNHRELPFSEICRVTGANYNAEYAPIYSIMFNHLTQGVLGDPIHWLYPWKSATTPDFLDATTEPFPIKQQQGQFDCTLEIVETASGTMGLFKFNTALFSNQEAQTWTKNYIDYLTQLTDTPETIIPPIETQRPLPVAISATFTAEPLERPLKTALKLAGYHSTLSFAPFNQVFQSLIDSNSLIRRNSKGVNILLIRVCDLIKIDAAENIAETSAMEIVELIKNNLRHLKSPLVVVICESPKESHQKIKTLELRLENDLAQLPGITLVKRENFDECFHVPEKHLNANLNIGGIPYTESYFSCLGFVIAKHVYPLNTKPIKALIIDCDGTLWQGVVGEDGPEKLVIGEQQRAFQQYLLARQQSGIILCLCSKNNERDVWQVFETRSEDMVLKPEHFSFNRINWQPKSLNILEIAQDINISSDSMAFFDDSLVERQEVRSANPAVCIVEFPQNWQERQHYLDNFWPLDIRHTTEADAKRAAHYHSESKRQELQATTSSWQAFIDSLKLDINITPATREDGERLSQLSFRTNQFNTTLLRMDLATMLTRIDDAGSLVLKVHVADRFGDYGLVGAALGKIENHCLNVENLMISCRALGRTVEFELAKYLANWALDHNKPDVSFQFKAGDRNQPAKDFLTALAHATESSTQQEGLLKVDAQALSKLRIPDPTSANTAATQTTSPNPKVVSHSWPQGLHALAENFSTTEKIARHFGITRPAQPEFKLGEVNKGHYQALRATIKQLWEKQLKTTLERSSDSFFDLGGNSLLLAQTAIAMNQAGINVTLTQLFQYSSVDAISSHLASTTNEETSSSSNTIAHELALPYQRLKRYRLQHA